MKVTENKYQYTIGGIVYEQYPLVLGQISRLMKIVGDVNLPQENNVLSLISAFGDKLPKAFAIIFHVPGVSLKDKDIDKIASDIEYELTPEVSLEVIENFFDSNPISLLAEKIGKTVEKIGEKLSIGSKPSVPSSQEETLPKEI